MLFQNQQLERRQLARPEHHATPVIFSSRAVAEIRLTQSEVAASVSRSPPAFREASCLHVRRRWKTLRVPAAVRKASTPPRCEKSTRCARSSFARPPRWSRIVTGPERPVRVGSLLKSNPARTSSWRISMPTRSRVSLSPGAARRARNPDA